MWPIQPRTFLVVGGLLLAAGGCERALRPSPPAVGHVGAMREVMREGRSGPRISITDVVVDDRVIAVGMEPGLVGEITAYRGKC